jgi:hypothetical protein
MCSLKIAEGVQPGIRGEAIAIVEPLLVAPPSTENKVGCVLRDPRTEDSRIRHTGPDL